MSTIILNPFEIFGDGIPRNGLVAEYLFSNNYLDTSGNGYNGTNFSTTFTTDRKSQSNKAIALNGSNQYVTVPFPLPNVFTISTWVKLDNLTIDRTIIGNWSSQLLLYMDKGGGGDGYVIIVKDSTSTHLTSIAENSATLNWQHVLCTYEDGATGLKLYVDNVLKETAAGGPDVRTTLVETAIGVDSAVNIVRDMAGDIDDVRIWNRILNVDERTAVFKD